MQLWYLGLRLCSFRIKQFHETNMKIFRYKTELALQLSFRKLLHGLVRGPGSCFLDTAKMLEYHNTTPLTPDWAKKTYPDLNNMTLSPDWAKKTYPDPVMFWSFRHQITRQTALDCLVQFALFLSSLKPEHIYITQETGTLSTVHYHIPISKDTGLYFSKFL